MPALAQKALPAARAYADIAPAVPHALHMPSHTFTRVGFWKESVATNIRSAAEAEKTNGIGEAMHARDYMTYAYLQMGMDAQAKENVEPRDAPRRAWAAARRARPARARTRSRWRRFPRAMRWSGSSGPRRRRSSRGRRRTRRTPKRSRTSCAPIGAARAGRPADAAADIARLAAIRDREIEMKDEYWAEPGRHPAPRRRCVGDVRAGPQGRARSPQMRETADMEDLTDKSAVTPGPIAPARELLGFMLLENSQPKEALVEFEAVMKKEPNRFLAIYGAGKAAEAREAGGQGEGLLQADRRDVQGRRHRAAGAPVRAEDGELERSDWNERDASPGLAWRAIRLPRELHARVGVDDRHGGVVPRQARARQRVQRAIEREDQAQEHTDLGEDREDQPFHLSCPYSLAAGAVPGQTDSATARFAMNARLITKFFRRSSASAIVASVDAKQTRM